MRKAASILVFFFISWNTFAEKPDSISISNLESKIEILNNQVKEVRRDELNYQVEKNLLKETYGTNYQMLSLILTIILTIIGVIGYVGIRDINKTKKEYTLELANLKELQTNIKTAHEAIQKSKEQYDLEIQKIVKSNEEQAKRIKILEFKNIVEKFYNEKNYVASLENCIVALELSPDDVSLLKCKAAIYAKTKNYLDSISTYLKVLNLSKDDDPYLIISLTEVYLLSNQRKEYHEMYIKYAKVFQDNDKVKFLSLFPIIINFQDKNLDGLKLLASEYINKTDLQTTQKRIPLWDFTEMLVYMDSQPQTEVKAIAQNLLLYLDGQISANTFVSRTGITL